jgi:hypothetical protein
VRTSRQDHTLSLINRACERDTRNRLLLLLLAGLPMSWRGLAVEVRTRWSVVGRGELVPRILQVRGRGACELLLGIEALWYYSTAPEGAPRCGGRVRAHVRGCCLQG